MCHISNRKCCKSDDCEEMQVPYVMKSKRTRNCIHIFGKVCRMCNLTENSSYKGYITSQMTFAVIGVILPKGFKNLFNKGFSSYIFTS